MQAQFEIFLFFAYFFLIACICFSQHIRQPVGHLCGSIIPVIRSTSFPLTKRRNAGIPRILYLAARSGFCSYSLSRFHFVFHLFSKPFKYILHHGTLAAPYCVELYQNRLFLLQHFSPEIALCQFFHHSHRPDLHPGLRALYSSLHALCRIRIFLFSQTLS